MRLKCWICDKDVSEELPPGFKVRGITICIYCTTAARASEPASYIQQAANAVRQVLTARDKLKGRKP